jgi:hypothetical protein
MNSDSYDKQIPPEVTPRQGTQPTDLDLNVGGRSQPVQVPVFNCLVYISANAGGGVRARVGNFPGLECTASSERAALGKIVPAFKQRIAELMHSGTPIPWIEPPTPAEAGEQTRFIPVHL